MTLAYVVMSGEVVVSGCRQVTQHTTEAGHKGTLVADSGAWADLSTGSPEEAQSRQRSQA